MNGRPRDFLVMFGLLKERLSRHGIESVVRHTPDGQPKWVLSGIGVESRELLRAIGLQFESEGFEIHLDGGARHAQLTVLLRLNNGQAA